jgi:non-heme chloroperoxidase
VHGWCSPSTAAPKIDVPVLVIHGDADRILPFPNTSRRLPALIEDMELVVIEDGPHAIAWTHADQVNRALVDFVRSAAARPMA